MNWYRTPKSLYDAGAIALLRLLGRRSCLSQDALRQVLANEDGHVDTIAHDLQALIDIDAKLRQRRRLFMKAWLVFQAVVVVVCTWQASVHWDRSVILGAVAQGLIAVSFCMGFVRDLNALRVDKSF